MWKATEFHQFLLYSGPVALQGVISDVLYKHFWLIFVAISNPCGPASSSQFCDYANDLLSAFVTDVQNIYGSQMLVYNVHSLVHLADDVCRYGPLDNFSSIFENS